MHQIVHNCHKTIRQNDGLHFTSSFLNSLCLDGSVWLSCRPHWHVNVTVLVQTRCFCCLISINVFLEVLRKFWNSYFKKKKMCYFNAMNKYWKYALNPRLLCKSLWQANVWYVNYYECKRKPQSSHLQRVISSHGSDNDANLRLCCTSTFI